MRQQLGTAQGGGTVSADVMPAQSPVRQRQMPPPTGYQGPTAPPTGYQPQQGAPPMQDMRYTQAQQRPAAWAQPNMENMQRSVGQMGQAKAAGGVGGQMTGGGGAPQGGGAPNMQFDVMDRGAQERQSAMQPQRDSEIARQRSAMAGMGGGQDMPFGGGRPGMPPQFGGGAPAQPNPFGSARPTANPFAGGGVPPSAPAAKPKAKPKAKAPVKPTARGAPAKSRAAAPPAKKAAPAKAKKR